MPAGDAITTDFQFQIDETVFGHGTGGVWIDSVNVDGILDVPETKTQDVTLYASAGVYANPDYAGIRTIHIPVIIRNAVEGTLVTNLVALQTAWAPVAASVDLYFQWPGIGLFGFSGRPRGMTADVSKQRRGVIHALLRFDCPDPTMTVP